MPLPTSPARRLGPGDAVTVTGAVPCREPVYVAVALRE